MKSICDIKNSRGNEPHGGLLLRRRAVTLLTKSQSSAQTNGLPYEFGSPVLEIANEFSRKFLWTLDSGATHLNLPQLRLLLLGQFQFEDSVA